MKTLKNLILAFTLFFSLCIVAQKPEPVYSIVRAIHDFDWYEQQAKAWKQEIDNGTKNNMAWVYWFQANKYALYTDSKKWESKVGSIFMEKEKIVQQAEKAIPNTFEYYFLKANDDAAGSGSGEDYILKAQSIRPFDPLLLSWLMNHYQFKNDKTNIELTAKKWFESNEMPQEILAIAYNNLISLDQNAILLVNGDNDTYPYWVLQNSQNIRKDVLILNLSLSSIDFYRNQLFKDNGIKAFTFEHKSKQFSEDLIKHLIENSNNRPIYVSVFTDQNQYSSYVNKMYLTGLSYKYSENPFDNLAVLRNNVENKFLLDFLKFGFYNNPAQSVVNQMNAGYIAIFLKLYEHYQLSGETAKATSVKQLAKKVSENSGYTEWMKYFEK